MLTGQHITENYLSSVRSFSRETLEWSHDTIFGSMDGVVL